MGPKRPLSAYNLFFQSERIKIIDELSSDTEAGKADRFTKKNESKQKDSKRSSTKSRKPPHGKVGFEELGRLIGARWKELPEEEKKDYQDKAVEESNRYAMEMEEYHRKEKTKES